MQSRGGGFQSPLSHPLVLYPQAKISICRLTRWRDDSSSSTALFTRDHYEPWDR